MIVVNSKYGQHNSVSSRIVICLLVVQLLPQAQNIRQISVYTFQTKLTRLSVWFFMPKPVDKTKTLFSLPDSINQIQTMLMRFIRNSLLTEPRHC